MKSFSQDVLYLPNSNCRTFKTNDSFLTDQLCVKVHALLRSSNEACSLMFKDENM